jgi:integrase
MATIKAFIRTTVKSKPTKIRLRLSDGRNRSFYAITDIDVLPEQWNPEREELKGRVLLSGEQNREQVNASIANIKNAVLVAYANISDKSVISTDWLVNYLRPPKVGAKSKVLIKTLSDYFEEYRTESKVSAARKKTTKVFGGILERYEAINGKLSYKDCNSALVVNMEKFMREEHLLQELHPVIYANVKGKIRPRGQNTLNDKLKVLSAFFTWSRKKKYFKELPFEEYEYSSYVYADPVPLLPEEVDHLYSLTNIPENLILTCHLFCLQCYIGCRVGDFVTLRKENVQDDILMYIPSKTMEDTPVTIYVPLTERAMTLINRYAYPEGKLMPFFNINGKDGYNKKIKKLCTFAELNRSVVVINPLTRKSETKQLCDVVSSHTARKTFINSNYMETQDPALISKMTGHAEGSKAFARYRNIDLDILRKQVNKAFEKK